MTYVEYYTLNFFTLLNNINTYPREYNKFVDYYSMVLPYYGQLCDTVIPDNVDLIRNHITEIRYLVLRSFHVGVVL